MFRQVLVLTAVFAGVWALGSDEPASADVAHVATATAAETSAAQPADLPKVPVRIGYHRGYDRLVFVWPSPVDYRVTRKGDWVELRFTSAADVDLAKVAKARHMIPALEHDRRYSGPAAPELEERRAASG